LKYSSSICGNIILEWWAMWIVIFCVFFHMNYGNGTVDYVIMSPFMWSMWTRWHSCCYVDIIDLGLDNGIRIWNISYPRWEPAFGHIIWCVPSRISIDTAATYMYTIAYTYIVH
jgi:hypothetical protein